MADLGFDYNAEDHKPLESRDPIPADRYTAMIVESERKPTKNAGGELLNLTWAITEGEHQGRRVWDRVNLKNANPQAVEIGMRQLSSICHATGHLRVQDSAELHDIPCEISVKVVPAGPDKSGVHREAKNEITGYAPIGEQRASAPARGVAVPARQPAPATAQRTATAAVATAPATPARKPWERK